MLSISDVAVIFVRRYLRFAMFKT